MEHFCGLLLHALGVRRAEQVPLPFDAPSRKYLLLALPALLLLAFWAALLKWPFTKAQTIKTLESRSGRKVTIGGFEATYFPPGMVVRDIRFWRIGVPENQPSMTVKEIVVKASWSGLLASQHRIPRVDVSDLHVSVPPRGENNVLLPLNGIHASEPGPRFDQVVFHTALVEFLPSPGGPEPLRFLIRELVLTQLKNNEPFRFEALVDNPLPRGEVHEEGTFGPWNEKDPSRTPVRGTFMLRNAHLSDIRGIAGTLQSDGNFKGTLDKIEVAGTARIPDFHVLQSSHTESLATDYQAFVNATNGDVQLNHVDTRMGRTLIRARGRVSGVPGVRGKTAMLEATVDGGRAEDLERMLMKSKMVPLSGRVSLATSIRLPPGPEPFLVRLEMEGNFQTTGEKFANAKAQSSLNALAGGAVDSRMRAHVRVKGGVARVSKLLLTCPETTVRMGGTFNLRSRELDLKGTLRTDGKLSNTQRGMKEFAVKMITPFLRRHGESVVPFEIKGPYGHLQTKVDLFQKRGL